MRIILLIVLTIVLFIDGLELLSYIKYKKVIEEITKSEEISLPVLIFSFLPPFLVYILVFGVIKNFYVLGLTLIMWCKTFFSFLKAYKLFKNKTIEADTITTETFISIMMLVAYDIIVLVVLIFRL